MSQIQPRFKKLINPIFTLCLFGTFLGMGTIEPVFSHAGHGDEFNSGTTTTTTNATIEVDETTAQQMGIRVESINSSLQKTGIKTTGQIETLFDQQVEVNATTGGKVVELLVQPGDRVEKGQPLAVISSFELLELRVESQDRQTTAKVDRDRALANLELAQQDLASQKEIASAEIISARTELAVAQERYDRDLELEAAGALPRRQMMDSKAELAKVQSNLQQALSRREVLQAEAELKRSRSEVEAAKTRVGLSDRTYQTRLQQLSSPATEKGLVIIYAPISGIVTHREVTLGESFDEAGGKLMTLANNQEVLATANIYEKDLSKVEIGQQVNVSVESLPDRTFTATVTQIDSMVEDTTRVIPVRSRINNPEGILKPGMFAQLEILTEQTANPILAIPKSAIIEANSKQLIYIQNSPTTYQAVEVTLGESFNNLVEVKQGLFSGDAVVVEGANMLYAQSLRGGSESASTADSDTEETTTSTEMNPWILLGIGGFVALGAFFVGRSSNQSEDSSFAFLTENENNDLTTNDLTENKNTENTLENHPVNVPD